MSAETTQPGPGRCYAALGLNGVHKACELQRGHDGAHITRPRTAKVWDAITETWAPAKDLPVIAWTA